MSSVTPRRLRLAPALLALAFAWLVACQGKQPAEGSDGTAGAAVVPVATVATVEGAGGLTSPDLAPGTFLGPQATLRTQTPYTLPPGTRAELALEGGGSIRVDEGTRLSFAGPRRLELSTGRAVALVPEGAAPVELAAAGDTLEVDRGEAQLAIHGEQREVAVVYGAAAVRTGGERVELGSGSTLQLPLAEPKVARPRISMRPLEKTAWSQAFEQAKRLVRDVPAGIGSLTARIPRTQTEVQPLALQEQLVHVAISGRVARTEVEQTFRNDSGRELEGTYTFPVPQGASISSLSLLVGNTWVAGEMVEKVRARRIFKEIVDATVPRDPALLEWKQGNVFKMKIFPIPPHGTRSVRIAYTQVLPVVDDHLRYRYPLGGSGSGAQGTRIERFAMRVEVDERELDPSRRADLSARMVQVQRSDTPGRVVLAAEERDFAPAHDVGVDLPMPPVRDGLSAQASTGPDGRTYVLATLWPEMSLAPSEIPSDYVIVFDRSHSTPPEAWTAARGLWQAAQNAILPEDRVAVLACDTACDVAPGALAPLGPDRSARIDAFLDGQVLAGASDLGAMIRRAAQVAQAGPGAPARRRVVVYLGDGVPSSGELAPDELVRHLGDVLPGLQVEAVALGARADLTTLNALARAGGGGVLLASPGDDLRPAARQLALRMAVPTVRGANLSFPPGAISVHPRRPFALRPGEPLTILAAAQGGLHGTLSLTGRAADGTPIDREVPMDVEPMPAFTRTEGQIAHLWAREEIEARTATEGYAGRDAIVGLSKRFNVVSRFTSLLVLENDAMYRRFGINRRNRQQDTRGLGNLGLAGVGRGGGGFGGKRAKDRDAGVLDDLFAEATARPEPNPYGRGSGAGAGYGRSKRERAPAKRRKARRSAPPAPAPAAQPASSRPAAPTGGAPVPLEEEAKVASGSAESRRPNDEPFELPVDLPDPSDECRPGSSAPHCREGAIAIGRPFPPRPSRPRLGIVAPDGATAKQAARIPALLAARDAAPTSRRTHADLVHAALAAGDPRALEFARAWAAADPDHAPALDALADALARAGDPLHLRTRAGMADADPFSSRTHERLARAFEATGDLARACSHRRAQTSIDPKDNDAWVALARCHVRAGETARARALLSDGLTRPGRARSFARRGRHGPPRWATTLERLLRDLGSGDLRVENEPQWPRSPAIDLELSWGGRADLDLAVMDTRGRLDGPTHPRARDLVGEDRPGYARMTLRRVPRPLFVEVTAMGAEAGPARGTLTVRAGGKTRVYPVELARGTLRLAQVIRR